MPIVEQGGQGQMERGAKHLEPMSRDEASWMLQQAREAHLWDQEGWQEQWRAIFPRDSQFSRLQLKMDPDNGLPTVWNGPRDRRMLRKLHQVEDLLHRYGQKVGTPNAVTEVAQKKLAAFDEEVPAVLSAADTQARGDANNDIKQAQSLKELAEQSDADIRQERAHQLQALDDRAAAITRKETSDATDVENRTREKLEQQLNITRTQARDAHDKGLLIEEAVRMAPTKAKKEREEALNQAKKKMLDSASATYRSSTTLYNVPDVTRSELTSTIAELTGFDEQTVTRYLSRYTSPSDKSIYFGTANEATPAQLKDLAKIQSAIQAMSNAQQSITSTRVSDATPYYGMDTRLLQLVTRRSREDIETLLSKHSGYRGSPSVWSADYPEIARLVTASETIYQQHARELKIFSTSEVRTACEFAKTATEGELAASGFTRAEIERLAADFSSGNYVMDPGGRDYVLMSALQKFQSIRQPANEEIAKIQKTAEEERGKIARERAKLESSKLPANDDKSNYERFIQEHTISVATIKSVCEAAQKFLDSGSPYTTHWRALFPNLNIGAILAQLPSMQDLNPLSPNYKLVRRMEAFVREAVPFARQREGLRVEKERLENDPEHARAVATQVSNQYVFNLQSAQEGRLKQTFQKLGEYLPDPYFFAGYNIPILFLDVTLGSIAVVVGGIPLVAVLATAATLHVAGTVAATIETRLGHHFIWAKT